MLSIRFKKFLTLTSFVLFAHLSAAQTTSVQDLFYDDLVTHVALEQQPTVLAATMIKVLTQKNYTQQPFTTELNVQISEENLDKADQVLSLSPEHQKNVLISWLVDLWLNKQQNQQFFAPEFGYNKQILIDLFDEVLNYEQNQSIPQEVWEKVYSFINLDDAEKPNVLFNATQSTDLQEKLKNITYIAHCIKQYCSQNGSSSTYIEAFSFTTTQPISLIENNDFAQLPPDLQLYVLAAWLLNEWSFISSETNNEEEPSFCEEEGDFPEPFIEEEQ